MSNLERKLTNELIQLKKDIKLTRGLNKTLIKRKNEVISELNSIKLRYRTTRSDKGTKRIKEEKLNLDDLDFGMF